MCEKCGCYQDFVSCDPTTIAMKAKLTAITNYFYTITDHKGTIITKPFTTDANGYWSIEKADLPDDFLMQGTEFTVTVTAVANNNLPLQMMITQPINCIDVKVKCIEGEVKAFIGW
jgi:hypothetical protein